jgi:transposase
MQNEFVSAVRPVWPEIVDGKTFFSRTDSAGLLALTSQYPTPHDVKKAGLANIKKLLRQACGRSQDELAKRLVDHAKSISPLQKANPCSASIIKTMSRNLTRQVESVKDMEKQMEAQLQDHPFGQWLLEQEGIGPRTAALFMGEAGDLSRYPGEAQLARVSGNGAVRCQSGKSQEKHYDGHRYNHRLKRVLIIMAQSRSQHHALSREFKKKRLDRGIKYWKVMKQLARYILRFLWKSWGKVMDNLGVNSTCAENFC